TASVDEARAAAEDVGYPVLLKARAGGGGKGMRLVEVPGELADAYGRAASEALAAFGDGRLYLEQAIAPARHVEVQVLCDADGGPGRGHAIGGRINAEDPSRDCLPAPGTVERFRPPLGPGMRVDTHVEDGTVIPPYYDSLLAKLIVWDEDRPAALERCLRALR